MICKQPGRRKVSGWTGLRDALIYSLVSENTKHRMRTKTGIRLDELDQTYVILMTGLLLYNLLFVTIGYFLHRFGWLNWPIA